MMVNLGLTEQLLFTTVRIETITTDGYVAHGTGFIYRANATRLESGETQHQPVVITNRHVVKDAQLTRFWLNVAGADGQPILGNHQCIELSGTDIWFSHPMLDLAFCGLYLPLEALKRRGFVPFYRGIEQDAIPSPEEWLNIMPAEDVLMIGYPGGHWDEVNNLPFVRRGIVASLPSAEFQGRHEFPIDVACFPGSSGSPVFMTHLGRRLSRDGVAIGDVTVKLIGILWGGLITTANGEVKTIEVPVVTKQVAEVEISMLVGLCIKSDCLADIDEMVAAILVENQAQGVPELQEKLLSSGDDCRQLINLEKNFQQGQ